MGFIIAILWYSYDITRKLRLSDDQTVFGKVEHFQQYEFVGDLDQGLHTSGVAAGAGARQGARQRVDGDGYCPINESSLDEAMRSRASVGRTGGGGGALKSGKRSTATAPPLLG